MTTNGGAALVLIISSYYDLTTPPATLLSGPIGNHETLPSIRSQLLGVLNLTRNDKMAFYEKKVATEVMVNAYRQ